MALTIAGFSGSSRVIRSAVLTIKESEYVMAAKGSGCGEWVIIFRHILPNVAAPIIFVATMGLGNAILAESALSFLGIVVPPAGPVLGTDAQRRRAGLHAPGPLAEILLNGLPRIPGGGGGEFTGSEPQGHVGILDSPSGQSAGGGIWGGMIFG